MPLKLIRRSRSENWYIRGTIRGAAVFESTGTSDREAAEAIRIKRESEVLERGVYGKKATASFLEAAALYLETAESTRFIAPLVEHFKSARLRDIDQAELNKAARTLYPNGSPATRNRQCYTPFVAIWNAAAADGLCDERRWRRPKIRQANRKAASVEWFNALLPECDTRLGALLILMLTSGIRISEAVNIDRERHCELSERRIFIERTKNGEARWVHLTPLAVAAIANLPLYKNGRLFGWMTRGAVYKPLRQACARAGIEYLPTHQLGSHTWATWMKRYAGAELTDLIASNRWKDIKSVLIYQHVEQDDVNRKADDLPIVSLPGREAGRRGTI